MFFHKQELQFTAKPDKPDAIYARRMQEVLGGQYGEISVAMQYAFQGWNMHLPGKYRDLVFGIAAEEFGHVEMLAVMIAQLYEKLPVEQSEVAAKSDPVLGAIIGGTDVQAAIVAGAGVRPVDSNGNPWQGSYITASGNLLADFTANANAEMQGRLQAARIYQMTDDKGVRDLLSFLLARDTMHQNQWTAAAAELRAEGYEDLPVPSNFPISKEVQDVEYKYINFSDGAAAKEGTWANGPTPDGRGTFSYEDAPYPKDTAAFPPPTQPDERYYGTTPKPNLVEKAAGTVKDAVSKK
ncbi:manganese catalase family protein [Amnibacterium setariae]|uniref:Manganese catalase family protein n=1 Tax=Amnibacterium setariae TaxID=2306585 RepID=A0A3A1U3V7_9MICO|nr:manganese catalase family protein [Amnibacterium setariae]RIX31043.1 manganese catalase family protein [Amnibacterium setariae]